jgi:hypothetical protein
MSRTFSLKPWKPKLSENDVEKACLDYLATRGYWTIRLHAGVFRTLDGKRVIHGVPKGTPDYVVLHATLPGFLLEVKRPKATISKDQELLHSRLRVCRIRVATVSSIDQLFTWVRAHETGLQ